MTREPKFPAEREAEAQYRALAAFDRICPGIVGNPFIPHWPTPPQVVFLGSHLSRPPGEHGVYRALYGGSAGGGKSDALLMGAAQHVHVPGYAGILFRRTYQDLAQPGALLDRALEWWKPRGVHWNGTDKVFTFPSRAKISFAYLAHNDDMYNYQGAEFQYSAWDELTQWEKRGPFDYVGRSRIRRLAGSNVPLRTLAASNPGGKGHDWVKQMFMGGPDPETGAWVPAQHPYFPARIYDNPYLDQDEYVESLMGLHPTVRAQLLEGDWSARTPGDYFRREWFGPLLDPEKDMWPDRECVRVRWWDLAASEKDDAAYTAGVRMARHVRGVRAVEHCVSFRATPGRRDDLIVQTAQADGFSVAVGLEVEGGSGGPAQVEALGRRLRLLGFRVVSARPRVGGPDMTDRERAYLSRGTTSETGKAGRADPVASCLERGYQRRGEAPETPCPWWGEDANRPVQEHRDGLRLFAGPWTARYLDIVEGFPESATCDEVDATSGAWAWLEAHSRRVLPVPAEEIRMVPGGAREHDVTPDERPDPRPYSIRSRQGPVDWLRGG